MEGFQTLSVFSRMFGGLVSWSLDQSNIESISRRLTVTTQYIDRWFAHVFILDQLFILGQHHATPFHPRRRLGTHGSERTH